MLITKKWTGTLMLVCVSLSHFVAQISGKRERLTKPRWKKCCRKPHRVYVNWSNLVEHPQVRATIILTSQDTGGEPLAVQTCRKDLSPCRRGECTVINKRTISTTLSFTEAGVPKTLYLEYEEDKRCKCLARREPVDGGTKDVAYTLNITNVAVCDSVEYMSPVLGGVVDGRVSADGGGERVSVASDGGRVSASGGEMAVDVYSSVFVSCEAPTPLRPPYIVTIVCRHCPVKIIVSFEPKEELWSRNTPGDSHRGERGLFTILEVDREDEQKGPIIPHQYGKLELPHPGDHRYKMRTEDNWVGRVYYVEAGCGGSGYLLTNLTEDGAGGSFSCTTADDSEQSRKKTTKVKKRPTNPQTPTLTYTSWPDLKTHLEVQFPDNVSLPEDVRGVHLPVRRCLPELHPCPSPRHHYLPDKRHLRKVFMRLKPRGQLNIDLDLKFKEDVACRCKERSPSLSSSSAASSLLMPPLPPLSNSLKFIDVQLRTVPNKVTRCKPVTMYVPWEDVRNYINTVVRDLMIPPHHRARPLPVKRCHQTLAPCEKPDYYCGLVLDGRASKKLYLYGRNVTLQVGFYEDKKCECMSEDRYNILRDHSLPGVPVITYVKVIRDNLV